MGQIIPKTAAQIQKLRESGKVHREILQSLQKFSVAGKTTREVDERARKLCRENKVEPSFLGFGGFPGAVCVSVNNEIVHVPPSEKVLKSGDIFSIDLGVCRDGWHTDGCVTFGIGKISPAAEKLISATEQSLRDGIGILRAGVRLGDLGAQIQNTVEAAGFSVVENLTGHGIGKGLHEPPRVFNFGKKGSGEKLSAGTVLAIEPIVCEKSAENFTAADGFAILTVDGSLSAHFEHTVVVTEKGAEVLT
jgi:methionyl aminopeptidase